MDRSRRKQLVCFELSKALNTGADRGAPVDCRGVPWQWWAHYTLKANISHF